MLKPILFAAFLMAPVTTLASPVPVTMPVTSNPAASMPGDFAPMALNSLSAVPNALWSAQVYDQSGHIVGQVLKVQGDQDGKPAALLIQPAIGKPIVVAASAVSYDQPHNILIASADAEQVAQN